MCVAVVVGLGITPVLMNHPWSLTLTLLHSLATSTPHTTTHSHTTTALPQQHYHTTQQITTFYFTSGHFCTAPFSEDHALSHHHHPCTRPHHLPPCSWVPLPGLVWQSKLVVGSGWNSCYLPPHIHS